MPRSVKILQQGPARSMGGGRKPAASVDESPPQKKQRGPGKTQGGPGPPGPPHATGLVRIINSTEVCFFTRCALLILTIEQLYIDRNEQLALQKRYYGSITKTVKLIDQTSVNISTSQNGILMRFGHDIPRYIGNISRNFRSGTNFGGETTVKNLIQINHQKLAKMWRYPSIKNREYFTFCSIETINR